MPLPQPLPSGECWLDIVPTEPIQSGPSVHSIPNPPTLVPCLPTGEHMQLSLARMEGVMHLETFLGTGFRTPAWNHLS